MDYHVSWTYFCQTFETSLPYVFGGTFRPPPSHRPFHAAMLAAKSPTEPGTSLTKPGFFSPSSSSPGVPRSLRGKRVLSSKESIALIISSMNELIIAGNFTNIQLTLSDFENSLIFPFYEQIVFLPVIFINIRFETKT